MYLLGTEKMEPASLSNGMTFLGGTLWIDAQPNAFSSLLSRAGVAKRTGCKILLAQKAFSNYDLYPVLSPYLDGTEASGLYETLLAQSMEMQTVQQFNKLR